MGWAARIHEERGDTDVLRSRKARMFSTVDYKPGVVFRTIVKMSDRRYFVAADGSFRRVRPKFMDKKAA